MAGVPPKSGEAYTQLYDLLPSGWPVMVNLD